MSGRTSSTGPTVRNRRRASSRCTSPSCDPAGIAFAPAASDVQPARTGVPRRRRRRSTEHADGADPVARGDRQRARQGARRRARSGRAARRAPSWRPTPRSCRTGVVLGKPADARGGRGACSRARRPYARGHHRGRAHLRQRRTDRGTRHPGDDADPQPRRRSAGTWARASGATAPGGTRSRVPARLCAPGSRVIRRTSSACRWPSSPSCWPRRDLAGAGGPSARTAGVALEQLLVPARALRGRDLGRVIALVAQATQRLEDLASAAARVHAHPGQRGASLVGTSCCRRQTRAAYAPQGSEHLGEWRGDRAARYGHAVHARIARCASAAGSRPILG